MEPEWTRQIPNWLVCDWFYVFFLIGAISATLLLVLISYLTATAGFGGKDGAFKVVMLAVQLAIAVTTTLFYYLICTRSLNA